MQMTLLEQPLFLNRNVTIEGVLIIFRKWWEGGIRQVRDVFHEFTEGFLPLQAIADAIEVVGLEKKSSTLKAQFGMVKRALPVDWVHKINNLDDSIVEYVELGVYMEREKDRMVEFLKVKTEVIYGFFKNKAFQEPVANRYITEEDIWRNGGGKYIEPTLKNFTYIMRHNCLLTEMRLFKIGLNMDIICKVCGMENEGLLHMFFYCTKLIRFQKALQKLLNRVMGEEEKNEWEGEMWEMFLLFGPRRAESHKFLLNLILAVARYSIWMRRNIAKGKGTVLRVESLFEARLKN